MPNSDNTYKQVNLHILEDKIEELLEVMENLKEKNKTLKAQIDDPVNDDSEKNSLTKRRKIKEKIENMVDELDSIL